MWVIAAVSIPQVLALIIGLVGLAGVIFTALALQARRHYCCRNPTICDRQRHEDDQRGASHDGGIAEGGTRCLQGRGEGPARGVARGQRSSVRTNDRTT